MNIEQWISVDEHLPTNNDDVLIAEFYSCGDNGGMVKGWLRDGFQAVFGTLVRTVFLQAIVMVMHL